MRAPIAAALIFAAVAVSPASAGTITVTVREVADLKPVFGTVESVYQTQARARITGTLVDLQVREGDTVKTGERLGTVVDPKLAMQMAETDARIRALRAERAQADLDLGRIGQLRKTGTASQAQYDQAQTKRAVADGQLAALIAARAQTVEQQAQGAVLAPVDGRILKVNAIAGTVLMPGEPVATIATQTYVLRIRLPERHARFIKAGDHVLVGDSGMGGDGPVHEGTIRLVYPEIDQGRVVADVETANLGNFFVGERTRVYVATGQRPAIVVPAAAVYRRYGVDFVKLADGAEIPVQLGRRTDDGVEVLSGLKAGDAVVVP